MQREVYIVSGVRTAIGDFGGSLKDLPPTELGAPAPSTVSTFTQTTPDVRRRRSPEEHYAAVEVAKERIRAGDAFQVVVSQRFETALGS